MKTPIFENIFSINTKVLIPCEISTMTNKQTLALFYFHIPKFIKFWDVTNNALSKDICVDYITHHT